MQKTNQPAWIKEIVDFIGEYTRSNPGYSSGVLKETLEKSFLLNSEDAQKLAELAVKELSMSKIGLAAMELNLTFSCNLTCEYCFVHKKSPSERMTFPTAKKAIDLLMERAAYPSVNITLIGGEPLLEFNLIKQIVPYAEEAAREKNRAVTWSVTTNGTLIDEEILKFFAQYKINLLLSIDGGQETHDRCRRTKSGEGTWQKIAGLIPLIKMYQPWLGARMTVSTEAIDQMREDFHQIVKLGFNQFIIAPAQGAICWSKEQLERYSLNLVKILQDYHQLKRSGFPIFVEEFEKDEFEYTGWGCRAGNTSLAIAPNGDVSPCSKLLGLTEETGRYIVGNVNSEINAKLFEPFQNPISHQPGHCKQCSRKCAGGCYAVNFEQTGDHFLPSEENCLFWAICQEAKRLSKLLGCSCLQCSGC